MDRKRNWITGRGRLAIAAATLLLPLLGTVALAQDAGTRQIVAVEEDWELVLLAPDYRTGSPQVATQMVPDKATTGNYAIFCINYQQVPTFAEGGIELQFWEGDWNADVNGFNEVRLSNDGETITWTQFLRLKDNHLTFGIKDGKSQTYGDFGDASLNVRSQSTYSSLAGYDPSESVKNSGATLGSNRVKSLKLKAIRKVFSDGTTETDNNPKILIEETEGQ